MGIGYSTPSPKLTQEQQDVKYLGERMPFGDEELRHVYRVYQAMKSKAPEERISFLIDIGVQSVPLAKQEERMILLQAVEHKLLPPNLGNRLYETAFVTSKEQSEYNHGDKHQEDPDTQSMVKVEAFFEGLAQCSRRGNAKALKVLFECCQPQTTDESSASKLMVDPLEFVNIGYRVGLASGFLSAAGKEGSEDVGQFFPDDGEKEGGNRDSSLGLKALAESLVAFCHRKKQRLDPDAPPPKFVCEEEVQEWAEQVAPMLGSGLATLTHMLFFPERPYPPTRTNFDYPTLAEFTSTVVSKGNSSLLFSYACMSPSLGGEVSVFFLQRVPPTQSCNTSLSCLHVQYYRLYTSASDGLSFNRLQNALLGYGGPTLLIIQSGDCVFGAFTASSWKESKDFYGNHDCFLYQLLPKTAVYRPTGNASNFMYCNPNARSRGYDQQAHGIGFGGTVDQPRLFLAESFDNCRAAAQDMTFESGRLLDHKGTTFEIHNLEVWGVGGTEVVQEALGARSLQRDIKNAVIQKARKVDKAQFLDDFRSGLIESKAFQHRDQIRGRADAAINDEEMNHRKA